MDQTLAYKLLQYCWLPEEWEPAAEYIALMDNTPILDTKTLSEGAIILNCDNLQVLSDDPQELYKLIIDTGIGHDPFPAPYTQKAMVLDRDKLEAIAKADIESIFSFALGGYRLDPLPPTSYVM